MKPSESEERREELVWRLEMAVAMLDGVSEYVSCEPEFAGLRKDASLFRARAKMIARELRNRIEPD